jgi:DUF3089 family protein
MASSMIRPTRATLVAVLTLSAATPVLAATTWLCRPGLANDPCTSDMTATVENRKGRTHLEHASPAANPKVDCFYVYPTVSSQTTPNATLTIDPEETAVAMQQASRFSQVCRVFAPLYPQLTILGIAAPPAVQAQASAIAYAGVLDAWHEYLANDNRGRGVVLIGHSQGSFHLIRLIQDEIDGNAALRKQFVSAVLLGGNVTVKSGEDAGGDFQNVPACRSARQTGCVVAYSTFDHPPPADSLFGRPGGPLSGGGSTAGLDVLCVNPVSPRHGTKSRALQPYFMTAPFPGILGNYAVPVPSAPTPWVHFPGLYRAHCMQANGATWLQVDDLGTASDPRPRVADTLGPTWGLHLVDVNLALGDLVRLVRGQAAAYLHHRHG